MEMRRRRSVVTWATRRRLDGGEGEGGPSDQDQTDAMWSKVGWGNLVLPCWSVS
jgi:hypothetical protein